MINLFHSFLYVASHYVESIVRRNLSYIVVDFYNVIVSVFKKLRRHAHVVRLSDFLRMKLYRFSEFR